MCSAPSGDLVNFHNCKGAVVADKDVWQCFQCYTVTHEEETGTCKPLLLDQTKKFGPRRHPSKHQLLTRSYPSCWAKLLPKTWGSHPAESAVYSCRKWCDRWPDCGALCKAKPEHFVSTAVQPLLCCMWSIFMSWTTSTGQEFWCCSLSVCRMNWWEGTALSRSRCFVELFKCKQIRAEPLLGCDECKHAPLHTNWNVS